MDPLRARTLRGRLLRASGPGPATTSATGSRPPTCSVATSSPASSATSAAWRCVSTSGSSTSAGSSTTRTPTAPGPTPPSSCRDELEGCTDDEIEAITWQNAAREFHYDGVERLGRDACTVRALRSGLDEVDLSAPKVAAGRAPKAGTRGAELRRHEAVDGEHPHRGDRPPSRRTRDRPRARPTTTAFRSRPTTSRSATRSVEFLERELTAGHRRRRPPHGARTRRATPGVATTPPPRRARGRQLARRTRRSRRRRRAAARVQRRAGPPSCARSDQPERDQPARPDHHPVG